MNVYRIATSAGYRFIRAASAAHARVRLYKSQALKAHAVDCLGAYACIGNASAYDSAVATLDAADSTRSMRAAHKSGRTIESQRYMRERQRESISAKAQALLKALNLN